MYIIEDTRNKEGKHEKKHAFWKDAGVYYIRSKLAVGDYSKPPKIAVDTKEDMSEIAANIGGAAHARFREECKLAQRIGTQLIILVENDEGVKTIDDVPNWKNPRRFMSPKAITGKRLFKAMNTMSERYGVRFEFCTPEESGERIIKLLGEE